MKTKFYAKNQELAEALVAELTATHPMTVRQITYWAISSGRLPQTQESYIRIKWLTKRLREGGDVPFEWIVDRVRETLKPSSWSGLADFGETVRHAYRLDFWARLPHYVAVIIEKDALAAVIQPVTRNLDVSLHVIRGDVSLSYAHEIAEAWRLIGVRKPIFAPYLGDYDRKGFSIESVMRDKIGRYSGLEVVDGPPVGEPQAGIVYWQRLGLLRSDFRAFRLVPLPIKGTAKERKAFEREHGKHCAELDALPAAELRRRVEAVIEDHIDQDEWARLQRIEELEQQQITDWFQYFGGEQI